ncbi:MAG: G5 domain-containing protein, partial [Clostridia bacterium]|nr:G5 domain-containing protein [Clostridia bacterium]
GGSNGVKSQSILHYYQNGKLVESKLIRKNTYKKVDKIVARGNLVRPMEQSPLVQSDILLDGV